MKLTVTNVVQIGHAEIEIGDGLTLVAGPNEGGKSSLLRCLGALLCSNRTPLGQGVAADAQMLVRKGEKRGTASLATEGGTRMIEWKIGGTSEVAGGGNVPIVSDLAAGLVRWSELDLKTRYEVLAKAIGAAPTVQECRDARPADIGPEEWDQAIDRIKNQIEAGLWDDAFGLADAETKMAMGAWKQITGRSWTSKQGPEFRPQGLSPDPNKCTVARLEELRAKVKALDAEQKKLAGAGMSEAERAELQKLASEVTVAQERVDAARAHLAKCDQHRQDAQMALANTPKPGSIPPTCECPKCGVLLDVSSQALKVAGDPLTPEQVAQQKADYDFAQRTEREAAAAYTMALRGIGPAESYLTSCQQASEKLAAGGDQGQDTEALQRVSAELDAAKVEGLALKQYLDAWDVHLNIVRWVAVRDLCKPEGIRRDVLRRKLAGLNERLAELAKPLPGFVVAINETMEVTARGIPYPVLSGAARWLVDTILQLTVAELEGAPVIVIDGADVLTMKPRTRLLTKLLGGRKIAAVLGCAMDVDEFDMAPDLGAVGLGRTYWVQEGRAMELTARSEAA
jgi:hypothetical protein